jgi:hypothetical protein
VCFSNSIWRQKLKYSSFVWVSQTRHSDRFQCNFAVVIILVKYFLLLLCEQVLSKRNWGTAKLIPSNFMLELATRPLTHAICHIWPNNIYSIFPGSIHYTAYGFPRRFNAAVAFHLSAHNATLTAFCFHRAVRIIIRPAANTPLNIICLLIWIEALIWPKQPSWHFISNLVCVLKKCRPLWSYANSNYSGDLSDTV